MPITITDTTKNPLNVASGGTITPFSGIKVSNVGGTGQYGTIIGTGGGTLKIHLRSSSALTNLGTIVDPGAGRTSVHFDPSTYTYTFQTSDPRYAPPTVEENETLARLVYNAPTLPAGTAADVLADISFTGFTSDGGSPAKSVTGTAIDPTPVTLHVASPAVVDTPTLTPPPPPAVEQPVAVPPVAAPPPAAPPPAAAPPVVVQPGGSGSSGNFIIANQTTGQQTVAAGAAYTGPVSGLEREFILVTPDNVNITAQVPNVFINSGSGTDALDVSKSNGNNVLDGGSGSNFLTGGTGFDTFFLDYRNPTVDLFSTIVNFHSGDNLTIFGINQTDYMLKLLDNQGAVNAKGLDFAVDAPGKPHGNVVLAGFSSADIDSGKLTLSYGRTQDLPGLPGSEYLNIHGT